MVSSNGIDEARFPIMRDVRAHAPSSPSSAPGERKTKGSGKPSAVDRSLAPLANPPEALAARLTSLVERRLRKVSSGYQRPPAGDGPSDPVLLQTWDAYRYKDWDKAKGKGNIEVASAVSMLTAHDSARKNAARKLQSRMRTMVEAHLIHNGTASSTLPPQSPSGKARASAAPGAATASGLPSSQLQVSSEASVPFAFPPGKPGLRLVPLLIYLLFGLFSKGCGPMLPYPGGGGKGGPEESAEEASEESSKNPVGTAAIFGTNEYWDYWFSEQKKKDDAAMLKPQPAKACPAGYVPETGSHGVDYGNTIPLTKKEGAKVFTGQIQVGVPGMKLPLVIHTGKSLSWALSKACTNKGTEPIKKWTPASLAIRPMPFPCEVRTLAGKNPKPGNGAQVTGWVFSDFLMVGSRPFGRFTICQGFVAEYTYPHVFNETGVLALGKMIDMPIALPNLPLWKTLWMFFFLQLIEIIMFVPQFYPPLPPPDEVFAFYHHERGGCFIQGGYDNRYYKGPLHWFPVGHSPTSWTMSAIRDILVNDTTIGICPGGCLAAVHSGEPYITFSGPKGVAMIQATQVSPVCAQLETLPDVTFVMTSGMRIVMKPADYVKKLKTADGGLRCYGAWLPQPPQTYPGDVVVLGVPFLQKMFAVFDGKRGRIGLAERRDDYYALNGCKSSGSAKYVKRCIPSIPPILPGLLAGILALGALGLVAALLSMLRGKGIHANRRMALVALHASGKNVKKAAKMIEDHFDMIKKKAEELKEAEIKKREDLVPYVIEKLEPMGPPYSGCTRPIAAKALEITNDHIMNAVDYIMKKYKELEREVDTSTKPQEDLIPEVIERLRVMGFECSRKMAGRSLQVSKNDVEEAVNWVMKNFKRVQQEAQDDEDVSKSEASKKRTCEDLVDELVDRLEPMGYKINAKTSLYVLKKSQCEIGPSVKYVLSNWKELKAMMDGGKSKPEKQKDWDDAMEELKQSLQTMGFGNVAQSTLDEALRDADGNAHEAVYHVLEAIKKENGGSELRFAELRRRRLDSFFKHMSETEVHKEELSREKLRALQKSLGVEHVWEPTEYEQVWEPEATSRHFSSVRAPIRFMQQHVFKQGDGDHRYQGPDLSTWKRLWKKYHDPDSPYMPAAMRASPGASPSPGQHSSQEQDE